MDNKLIFHIAGEVIVVGGLAFYTKRTADQLNGRITELEKKVKEQDEAIKGLHHFLRNLFPPNPPPLIPAHPPQPPQPTKEQEEEKRLQEILQSAKQKKEKLVLKKPKAKKKDVSTEESTDKT